MRYALLALTLVASLHAQKFPVANRHQDLNFAVTQIAASATQVNFLIPASTPAGRTAISIRAAGASLAEGEATITAAGPGIFVLNPADPSQPGAVENQDSSVNTASHPAAKGSVIQIFATGYGDPVQVTVGGTPATVLYSAPVPQYPGLWQMNAQLPATAEGQAAVSLIAGHLASNAVTIWILVG